MEERTDDDAIGKPSRDTSDQGSPGDPASGESRAHTSSQSDASSPRNAKTDSSPEETLRDEDEGEHETPLYKRPAAWIVGAIVVVLVVVGGFLYWLHARQYESTDDAFVDAHIVRLAPQVAGVLSWVAPLDNRHVKAGQLLAVIEPSAPQAQRAEALAGVTQALAAVSQAQSQYIGAKAARSRTAADAQAPMAQAVKARADLARYVALRQIDSAAVAATQLDQAREQAESANGQALAARRDIASADANVQAAARQVDVARAQVAAARAKVQEANVTLGDNRLVAPVDGQVVNRSVNLGSYVGPGSQLLAIIPDQMWVTANFKETQITLMRPGQHVDIRLDAFPGIDFEGHVDSIQRGAGQTFALLPPQNATGNYVKVVQRVPVRILFDRPDPHRWSIGPGMSVTPRVKVR